jgi:DNA-binding beta-propeller fold protein YncE
MFRARLHLLAALLLAGCTTIVYSEDDHWDDPRDLPEIGNGKILITNSGEDTLTWLDLDTLEPVFEEPVGRVAPEREGPHHGAALPDGSAYLIGISNFVPGSGSGPHGNHGTGTVPGLMLKYDTATHELVGEVRVDRSPGDVRITPDGRIAVQSHFDQLRINDALEEGLPIEDMYSDLAIVDVATMDLLALKPICPAAHGIAMSDDSTTAYVTCWGTDELAVVTLTEPFEVTRFAAVPGEPNPADPRFEPYAVALSPADGTLWVAGLDGVLRIFDPATETWDETRGPVFMNGGAPFFPDFDSTGATLLVPVQNINGILKVDPATGNVTDTLTLATEDCRAPHAVTILPDDQRAVVVCEGDHIGPGTVAVITLDPFELVTTHEVGVYPDDAILLRQP